MERNTSVKDMSTIKWNATLHENHVYNNMGRNTSLKDMSTKIWDATLH